jgi:hypothetical protein
MNSDITEKRDNPVDILEWYNKYYPMEKIFIHTDKNIYKSGETIWFKAYVLSNNNEKTQLYSNDVYIKLLDQQGEELIYRRYPVNSGLISGNINLPRFATEGKYFLIAYTSWMKNGSVNNVFNKEIVITKNTKRKILVEFKIINSQYFSADSFEAIVNIKQHTGIPIGNASVTYTIQTSDKRIKQGNLITNFRGFAFIKEAIPRHKIDGACFIKLFINCKEGIERYIFPLPAASSDNTEIRFFTPNQYLLKNTENQIYIKTTNKFGMPVCCEGEIINQSGKAVLIFRTDANGCGTFTFTPTDMRYKARLIIPAGDSIYLLPDVCENGINIQYMGIKDKNIIYRVKVMPDDTVMHTSWIALSGHKAYWTEETEVKNNILIKIPLPAEREGLVQVSVFNQLNEILFDHLTFFKKTSNQIKITTNKNHYGKREKVTALISLTDTTIIHGTINFSLSVSPKHLTENNLSHNIIDYMIYENRLPPSINYALTPDTLIIVATSKDSPPVPWSKIYNIKEKEIETYYNRDGLTGVVLDKRRMPASYAKVKITNISNLNSYETQCDESGVFNVLFGSDVIDFNYLNINAFDATGKVILWPDIDRGFSDKIKTSFQLAGEEEIARQKTLDIYKYQNPDLTEAFRYTKKIKKTTEREVQKIYQRQEYLNYSNVLDIINNMKKLEIINDQIFFKGVYAAYGTQIGSLIVIDGIPHGTNVIAINNLIPPEIVYINISTNQSDVRRYSTVGHPAVIEITTFRGLAKANLLPGLSGIDIIEHENDFYSPDYSTLKVKQDDKRTTLYWNPHLTISPDKNQIGVTFYTSDITGTYVINIQGYDDFGKPVSASVEFIVNESTGETTKKK